MRNAGSWFARSTRPVGIWALGALLLILGISATAHSADAAVIHKPAGSWDLPENSGAPPPGGIAIDEQTSTIYVLGRYGGVIEKFDSEGNPVNFSGLLGPNEHQGVHFEEGWAEGDAFRLTCPNGAPTGEIEWAPVPFVIEDGIKEALETTCGGTETVTGPGGDFRNFDIEFGGTLGHQDIPGQISCAKVSGASTCFTSADANGAAGTNKLFVNCGTCSQFTVDNSGGPNQGVIYTSGADPLTVTGTENELVPNPTAGIHAFLPSGLPTHSTYQGQPVDPHPGEFEEGHGQPFGLGNGGLYTRSQDQFDVRACGVAVDPDGSLVIAHGGDSPERAYYDKLGILPWAGNDQQEGSLLGTINSDTANGCRIQVDSSGNLYYMALTGGDFSTGEGVIRKYSSSAFHAPSGSGEIPAELQDPSTVFHEGPDRAFALDAEDHLYGLRPAGPPRVQQVDRTGSLTETFGAEEFIEPTDITVDQANGTVYVADGTFEPAPDIHVYEALTVPNSITEPFELATQSSGVLHGEVDLAEAGEEVTNCEFEYTTELLFIAKEFEEATKVPCDQGTTFSADEAVSTEVSGLTLEETYKFRLVTQNANGTSNGNVRSFTPHAVIELATTPATNLGPRSATLNGSFTGNGDGTEFFFEFGTGPPGVYSEATQLQNAGSPNGAAQVSAPVSNLQIETTYHYRVVAVNGTGESKGRDQSFRTLPAVTGLTTEPASEIGQETVTLNAKFSGEDHDTKYYFEYGPTTGYGTVTSEGPVDAGATTGPTPVSSQITTYYGGTTYHYRVVAENEFGTTYGKDVAFTTAPAPTPELSQTEVDQVTPTTAAVSAVVKPYRQDASWLFEWGESTAYGSLTEAEPVLAGMTTQSFPVEATITGLEPATIYHLRAVAFNFSGVTRGPDITFKTPSAPGIEETASSAVTSSSAHLSARVLTNESPTEVHFDFGSSAAYGSSTSAAAIGAEHLARSADADLAGLAPSTTYHYRAVATNLFGTTTGPDQTFTTRPASGTGPVGPLPTATKKCPKGKVKKHGRCVPKHKRHKKKGKRHG